MLGGIGLTEIIIVLVIVMMLMGSGKLPEIGAALGKAIRGFRSATRDDDDSTEPSSQGAGPDGRDRSPKGKRD